MKVTKSRQQQKRNGEYLEDNLPACLPACLPELASTRSSFIISRSIYTRRGALDACQLLTPFRRSANAGHAKTIMDKKTYLMESRASIIWGESVLSSSAFRNFASRTADIVIDQWCKVVRIVYVQRTSSFRFQTGRVLDKATVDLAFHHRLQPLKQKDPKI